MASESLSRWLVVLLVAICAIFSSVIADIAPLAQQPLLRQTSDGETSPPAKAHRVAIIGAGAAGSSTAYHLHKFAANLSIPLSITTYESNAVIGGRSTTVNALDDPQYPAELGASIFVNVNHILFDAAAEFKLTLVEPDSNRPGRSKFEIGIWDGQEFVYKSRNGDMGWWDKAKLLWRYGLAPIKTQRLMKSTVAMFLSMYEEPTFPWRSLTEVADSVGLLDVTATKGEEYLKMNGIGERFAREVVQASTRVNYGQNLGVIHGLETMVCMATDGAVAVDGGNWQIFEGMTKTSQAVVKLNNTVEEIVRLDDGGYEIIASERGISADGSVLTHDRFDTIVLAAPYQFSNISVSPPLDHPPDSIPYVTLYVTLLTSPYPLSPKFFSTTTTSSSSPPSAEDQASVPEVIITTLPPNLDLGSSPHGVGPTAFWSVSTLRAINANGSTHYLYKIFSPDPLKATFVSQLLDLPKHYPPAATHPKAHGDAGCGNAVGDMSKEHISWFHEKKWHSYPYEYPRITFEELNLDGRGLWYTSGMESFISTMETSALMGKNVARLVVDELS